MQGFINGVAGAGKQSHLLAGQYGERAGLRQEFERGAAGVLHAQGVDQRGTALRGEFDLPGGSPKSLRSAQGMLVKGGRSIGMIQYVREQARSIGQIALSDAGTVHAWISLTDEQTTTKVAAYLNDTPAHLSRRGESWRCRYRSRKRQSP